MHVRVVFDINLQR